MYKISSPFSSSIGISIPMLVVVDGVSVGSFVGGSVCCTPSKKSDLSVGSSVVGEADGCGVVGNDVVGISVGNCDGDTLGLDVIGCAVVGIEVDGDNVDGIVVGAVVVGVYVDGTAVVGDADVGDEVVVSAVVVEGMVGVPIQMQNGATFPFDVQLCRDKTKAKKVPVGIAVGEGVGASDGSVVGLSVS